MRAKFSLALVVPLLAVFAVSSYASLQVNPTTTLTAEKANNTSSASTFTGWSNGNTAAGNISKENLHSLLPNPQASLFIEMQGWFGTSAHPSVGYDNRDPNHMAAAVNDMMSRGIDGVVYDWYGIGTLTDQVATVLRPAVENRPPFQFAMMVDSGAIKWNSWCGGCGPTDALIRSLNYFASAFFPSPAYHRIGGRPVVMFFGMEAYTIDWNAVRAASPNSLFIFRNGSGFTKAQSDGAYGWVAPTSSTNWTGYTGFGYYSDFYYWQAKYPNDAAYGPAWKGFDDTMASWSANRHVDQRCGLTWLESFGQNKPLATYLISTWDDYEEGSEIETGVDNCVALSASLSGTTLTWAIAGGTEATIDHYTIFISTDGQNLMSLTDVASGTHSLDLKQFAIPAGDYTLYVKAVGQPSITNKMSGPVSMHIAGNQPPTVMLNVNPTSGIVPVAVTVSTAGSSDPDGSIAGVKIDFGDGTVVSAASATHTYSVPGTYRVAATLTDNLGASSTQTATVAVKANQPPLASIAVSPASGTAPLTITATTASSSDPDGSIANSKIDFGDGTVVAGTTASHTYPSAGTYTVTGTVTDNLGASAKASATVTVAAPFVAGKATVISPAPGATVTSPVHFVASATADTGNTITAIRIYLDYASVYTNSAASLGTTLPITPGTHNVVVQAWDNTGKVYKSTLSITVSAPTGVSITSPVNGATVKSPVHFTASAKGNSPITTMRIYVDGRSAYVVQASSLNTSLKLLPGTHNVVIQAWDTAGTAYKSSLTITVP
jgi:PKD repeat protein